MAIDYGDSKFRAMSDLDAFAPMAIDPALAELTPAIGNTTSPRTAEAKLMQYNKMASQRRKGRSMMIGSPPSSKPTSPVPPALQTLAARGGLDGGGMVTEGGAKDGIAAGLAELAARTAEAGMGAEGATETVEAELSSQQLKFQKLLSYVPNILLRRFEFGGARIGFPNYYPEAAR